MANKNSAQTKQFQAESKRLLEMMIHSIYTHKEIFLRELVSNASDALDKRYFRTMADENAAFDRENFYIRISPDKEKRQLVISDAGIGMTAQELDENLGVIARSGSLHFKKDNELGDDIDIIGQFGVGFYSAFMVSDLVTVETRSAAEQSGWQWQSEGAEGYTITPCDKEEVGTVITLQIKANTDDENYDEFLDPYRLKALVKKYSDFIRYPIKMEMEKSRLKEGSEEEWEQYSEDETLNSMVPIWVKNKNELKAEDYEKFYRDQRYGYDKPLKYIHTKVEGTVSYNSILYFPSSVPYDFYTKEFQKGLELYSNGVLIMEKCSDLLPDYFGFVQGMVDSSDLSLNISRELLQHDRQLQFIAKKIGEKIQKELLAMVSADRENYETLFKNFGRSLKFGVYNQWGSNKEMLQDLLLFHSSTQQKLVTLAEYVDRMSEEQKFIYYACGDSVEKIAKLPQAEMVADKGYEILYFTEEVDEFAVKAMMNYSDKEFRNVSGSDLGFEPAEKPQEETQQEQEIFQAVKEILGDKVKEVSASVRLKSHPVCLSNQGDLSIEMEKVLSMMPDAGAVKAEKVLEINTGHPVFALLTDAFAQDKEKFAKMAGVLYNQALLIEGLPLEDPVAYANDVCTLMQ